MIRERKSYTADFKPEVARMVVDQGLGVAQVTKDMDIGPAAVRRWVDQYSPEQLGLPEKGWAAFCPTRDNSHIEAQKQCLVRFAACLFRWVSAFAGMSKLINYLGLSKQLFDVQDQYNFSFARHGYACHSLGAESIQ